MHRNHAEGVVLAACRCGRRGAGAPRSAASRASRVVDLLGDRERRASGYPSRPHRVELSGPVPGTPPRTGRLHTVEITERVVGCGSRSSARPQRPPSLTQRRRRIRACRAAHPKIRNFSAFRTASHLVSDRRFCGPRPLANRGPGGQSLCAAGLGLACGSIEQRELTTRYSINVTLGGCCHHEAGPAPDENRRTGGGVGASSPPNCERDRGNERHTLAVRRHPTTGTPQGRPGTALLGVWNIHRDSAA